MRHANTTIVHLSSQVGRSIIGFLATLYFANKLGATPLGIYFIAIALLAWVTIPSASIETAIKKRVSEGEDGEHLSAGLVLVAAFGIGAGVILIVAKAQVNEYIGARIAVLVAGLIFARTLFGGVTAGLQGQKRVAVSGLLKSTDQLFRAAFQVAFVIIGWGVAGLLIGHAVAMLVASTIGVTFFVVNPRLPSIDDFRELFEFAKFSWLGSIRTQTFSWMDILILNIFVVPALIGVYEVAWKLASIFVLINISIQHTLFPEISSLSTQSDYEKINDFVDEAMLFSGLFTIPGIFGAMVLGPEVLEIYSEEFVKGHLILVILLLARSIDVYGSVLITTLNAINRPDIAFKINLLFTVSNVALNLLLVYLYGWIGAAIATTISVTVVLILSYRSVEAEIGSVSVPGRGIVSQLVAGASMGIVIFALEQAITGKGTLITLGLVIVGIGIYGGILLLISDRVRAKTISISQSWE